MGYSVWGGVERRKEAILLRWLDVWKDRKRKKWECKRQKEWMKGQGKEGGVKAETKWMIDTWEEEEEHERKDGEKNKKK